MKKITARFHFEELGDRILRQDSSEKLFQSQIKTEFGYYPIKLQTILELLEEFCYRIKIERENTDDIYLLVSAEEPPVKPFILHANWSVCV